MLYRSECPICHALIFYDHGKHVDCEYCGNRLLVGTTDPTRHSLFEIDPDAVGGGFGALTLNLYPIGTHVFVK